MLLLLLACAPDPKPDDTGDTSADTADTGDTAGPPAWSAAMCDRLRPGPGGASDAVTLSALHAAVRLFEPSNSFATADDALAAALQDEGALAAPDLGAYATAVEGCALAADPTPLGAASATLVGDVAWVVPGTGAVSLPAGAAAVAVDLRDLPDKPELRAALAAAVSPALATPAAWPHTERRRWDGFVDQYFSSSNVYFVSKEVVPGAEIPAGGAADLPLIVVTGERLAPAAAELAVGLRAAGRAWIVGADVPAAVAEARWYPFGDGGVGFRAVGLVDAEEAPLPDLFPADTPTLDPEAAAAEWATWAAPGPVEGPADRQGIRRRTPYGEAGSTAHDLGTARVALLAMHGTLRRFFPYFTDDGAALDATLDAALSGLDPTDRCGLVERLGWMTVALADGHTFVGDLTAEPDSCWAGVEGYLGVVPRFVDGEPVVVQSVYADVHRGDTLVAVDGVPMEALMDASLAWHGAATEGYRLDLAFRPLRLLHGSVTVTLRDPDGGERDVAVDPVTADELLTLPFTEADRPNGTLADLGAPEVAYLNLDEFTTASMDQVDEVLALAGPAGLVVDMRGYPGVNHYDVVAALVGDRYLSPLFHVPTWSGPDDFTWVESQYDLPGAEVPYDGPIVLLVHPTTVSAAENFAMMLVGAGRLTAVVGERSAGTNGNITAALLPGELTMSFTGMEVRFPDGGAFHGIGIEPDLEVIPTAAELRDGVDPELEAALAILGG